MTNEGILSIFTFNRLQIGHRVKVDNYIISYWIHVPAIVQYYGDGAIAEYVKIKYAGNTLNLSAMIFNVMLNNTEPHPFIC